MRTGVAVILVLSFCAAYTCRYLLSGDVQHSSEGTTRFFTSFDAASRFVRPSWTARVFVPAAWVEAKITRVRVRVFAEDVPRMGLNEPDFRFTAEP